MYNPEPPTPFASIPRGQAPGMFSPVVGAQGPFVPALRQSNSSLNSESRSAGILSESQSGSVFSHSREHDSSVPSPLRPSNYSRVETTFLIEEAKARLLVMYQQEESLGVHLEAKRHSLLHLKSEIARTDQVIHELERNRVFNMKQEVMDRSVPQKDLEEVEKLSNDILKEERIVARLEALLEEAKTKNASFQQSLDRDKADRDEIKAAIRRISGKMPAAP